MKKTKLLLTFLTILIAIFAINIAVSATSEIYTCENHLDADNNTFCDVCDNYLSEVIETGRCGDSVNYTWYADGTVIISGEGPMWDCINGRSSPFKSHVSGKTARKIIIENNVTTIGFGYFAYPCSVKTIILSKDIKTIREAAFQNINLESIYFSGSAEEWKNITIEKYNEDLTNLSVNYNYCLSSKSTEHKNKTIYTQQNATCTNIGFTEGTYCSDCEIWLIGHKVIPATGHSYTTVITPADLTADGKIETKCSTCGVVENSETIAKISSVTLSKTNYIYDGKNKTPKVTVKDANGKTLTKNVDYKLSVASKRSGIGRYTVKVTFIGNYSGSKSVYFYIKPGKPATVKSASQTTSSVKLTWSAVPGAAGYTVYRYSPSKKAYVKAGTTEGTSYTVKSLYAGTKYTFRVVSYGKTSAGKVYDSDSYTLLKTATKTKTPTLSKVTASSTKGKAYVYHSDVSGETGYTVYYSTKKDSGFKKYANFKADTTRCDITNLTSGKTYYFKVRTYITTDSGYVYSAWSTVKSVKVK